MSTEKIAVLVVDDNPLLRVGLRGTISDETDMTPVGEAGSGVQALELYRSLQPDVVTMDYRMPNEDGLAATIKILDEFPDARILFLSSFDREEDIWNAWKAGVRGYLTKAEAVEQVVEAIRCIYSGETYFPAAIVAKLEARKEQKSLTRREMEVLQLIVDGHSNKEIMAALELSSGTIRMHVSHLLEKMGALDRTQAAIIAVKKGIIHID